MAATMKVTEIFTISPTHDKAFEVAERDVGESLQRLHVIKELPSLFQIDQRQCLLRVLPLIQSALNQEDVELHAAAAEAYLQLFTTGTVTPKDFVNIFLPSILNYLDATHLGVFNTWVNVLLELVAILPEESVNRKVFQCAWGKCQPSASMHERSAAARLLGRMCTRFDKQSVTNEIWPLLQSLSQDVSSLVRSSVCQQIHLLFTSMPIDLARRDLIPCMIELARDEEVSVRAEAIGAIVHLVPLVPNEELRSTMLPLVTSVCDRSKKAMDETTVRLASHFTELLEGLKLRGALSLGVGDGLFKVYNEMSSNRSNRLMPNLDDKNARCQIEIRRLGAENFPALLKFVQSELSWRTLLKTFSSFTNDPSPLVRKTIAQGLCKWTGLGIDRVKPVKRALVDLLKDSNEEVLAGVVPNLAFTVDLLVANGIFQGDLDTARIDLATAVISTTITLEDSRNWRLVEQLYIQLACAVRFLPSNYVFSHFYPRVLDKALSARPLPVRKAATHTLLIYLRYNLKLSQRQSIRDRLMSELLRSDSCHRRLLFVYLCNEANSIFSRQYFNTHFLSPLLSLKADTVVNVRLALAEQLIKLHDNPDDDERAQEAVTATIHFMLQKESDRDVIDTLKKADVIQLKERGVVEEMNLLDLKADRRKLDEEKRLSKLSYNAIALGSGKPSLKEIKQLNARLGHPNIPSRISRPPGTRRESSTSSVSSDSRTNRTNTCTCVQGGLAMEMSWLNLEMALHRELRALSSQSMRGSIFSSAFERDFYRDTGVKATDVIPAKTPDPPQLLARTGRSKSFVLPSTKLSKAPEPVTFKTTRIPISHRRSMDLSHWLNKVDVRLGDAPASRLPVRKKV